MNIQGHEQFFSTTVSTERMNWIKDMRRLCEDLCAVCEQYGPGELPPDQYAVFLRAKNGILLRLDPPGWYPQTGDRIVALLSDPDYAKIRENIPEIRDIAQRILKSEWDSVKCEAGNSLRKIRAIESMKKEIEGKYRTRV